MFWLAARVDGERAMARRRKVTDAETLDALGYAVTCAIFWAPERLLLLAAGERREAACRRLALRVLMKLAGDGWGERRRRAGATLACAIADGISRTGGPFLAVLPQMRRGDGRVLDALGLHIGAGILAAMKEDGTRLARVNLFDRR